MDDDALKDIDRKSVADCKMRFGENSPLPPLTFTGVSKINGLTYRKWNGVDAFVYDTDKNPYVSE